MSNVSVQPLQTLGDLKFRVFRAPTLNTYQLTSDQSVTTALSRTVCKLKNKNVFFSSRFSCLNVFPQPDIFMFTFFHIQIFLCLNLIPQPDIFPIIYDFLPKIFCPHSNVSQPWIDLALLCFPHIFRCSFVLRFRILIRMNDIDIEAEWILCGKQVHHDTSLAYLQMKKNTALAYADEQ